MSKFINDKINREENYRKEIDFEDAIRLPDGGSTCDIYRTKWQRHEVFVKRLKEEHRSNPLYLDALDKEYEIGTALKHPSLPDYREFHRDYIVMDYIDGRTLSDMIKSHDQWLLNEKNVIKMLRELIEVVDYLHRHNVTHCDIKPDNIMITSNNKNLMLIDLDKCYSDSINDTSGDPSKYGLSREQKGRIVIDFRGIAKVVDILKEKVPGFTFSRYSVFEKECNKADPSTDELLQILDYNPSRSSKKFYWMVILTLFFVAVIFGAFLFLTQGKDGHEVNYGVTHPSAQAKDTVSSSHVVAQGVTESNEVEKIEKPTAKVEIHAPLTQQQIHAQAQEMAAQLDLRIQPYFNELKSSLDRLEEMKSNPDVTQEMFSIELTKHIEKEEEYNQEAFEILKETYPHLSDREAWRVMAYSKAYTGYNRQAASFYKSFKD